MSPTLLLRWLGQPLYLLVGLGALSILLSLVFCALTLRGRRVPASLWLAAPWVTTLVALGLSWRLLVTALHDLPATPLEVQVMRTYWISRAPLLVAAASGALAAAPACLASGVAALRAAGPGAGWTWWPTVLTGGLTLLGAFALGMGVVFGQQGGWWLPGTLVVVGLGVALSGGRAVQGPEGAHISGHRARAWLMAVVAVSAVAACLPWVTLLEVVDRWSAHLPHERPGLVAAAWEQASHLGQLGGLSAVWAVLSLSLPSLWGARRLGSGRDLLGAAVLLSMLVVLVGAGAFTLSPMLTLADTVEPNARVAAADWEAPRPVRPGGAAAPLSRRWPACLLRHGQPQGWAVAQEHSAPGCPLTQPELALPLPEGLHPGLLVDASVPALALAQRPWFTSQGQLMVMVRAAQGDAIPPEAPWLVRAAGFGAVPLHWRAQGAEPQEELGFLVEGPRGDPWWVTRLGATHLGSDPEAVARGLNLALRDASQHRGALRQGDILLVAGARWRVQELVTLCLGALHASGGAANRCLLSQQSAPMWLKRHKVTLETPDDGGADPLGAP